jgi:hypothetical protein
MISSVFIQVIPFFRGNFTNSFTQHKNIFVNTPVIGIDKLMSGSINKL